MWWSPQSTHARVDVYNWPDLANKRAKVNIDLKQYMQAESVFRWAFINMYIPSEFGSFFFCGIYQICKVFSRFECEWMIGLDYDSKIACHKYASKGMFISLPSLVNKSSLCLHLKMFLSVIKTVCPWRGSLAIFHCTRDVCLQRLSGKMQEAQSYRIICVHSHSNWLNYFVHGNCLLRKLFSVYLRSHYFETLVLAGMS